MTELSGFFEYDPNDWGSHVRRLNESRVLGKDKRERLIKVPLLFFCNGSVLLSDMKNAPASVHDDEEDNRCLNLPTIPINPRKAFTTLHFNIAMFNRVFGDKGIIQSKPVHSRTALGIYKDYPADIRGIPTTVTVLPFVYGFSQSEHPEVFRDYEKFRGKSEWYGPSEAVRRLVKQEKEMPDNNLAPDATAMVQYFEHKFLGKEVLNAARS